MDERAERMARGVRDAMRAEAEGHHFYLMAAQTTADVQGREVFEQLALEELAHLEFLKKQHEALLATGRADREARLGARRQLSGPSPIFSPAIRERIGEAHFEMTALSVGMQLEHNAESFYRSEADEASDAVVRAFFMELADWEAGHYEALSKQQEALKEDYWSRSGFAPF